MRRRRMTKTERVEKVIRRSIEEVNAGRPPGQQVSADPATFLTKPRGTLDSLSVVELMVNVETGLEDEFGIVVSLAEVAGTPDGRGMFLTIEALSAVLLQQIKDWPDD
jgi:acyl carrier protein